MRCGLEVTVALGDISHPGQRVRILRVGLQHLFKLLLRRCGITAIEVNEPLTTRLAAYPLAIVILYFGILRVTLHPGIVKRPIALLRPQPQQRLA